jgi:membrane-associated PAP2 superfamily phosphatase
LNRFDARFYLIKFGTPLLLALLVFVLFDLAGLDITISNWLYNPLDHTFPFEHNRLFENITHHWARIIPNWVGELAIVGAMLSLIPLVLKPERAPARIAGPLQWLTRYRLDFFFVMVAFAIATGVIHYLKSHTSIYCPVETTLYGGDMPRQEWYENFNLLHEAGAGRCWPGGHASGGFTLVALYFVALRYRWRHASTLFWASMILGCIYGTTRVVQGWHFMSHTFWAGIFVWLSTLLTAMAFYGHTLSGRSPETNAAKPALNPA